MSDETSSVQFKNSLKHTQALLHRALVLRICLLWPCFAFPFERESLIDSGKLRSREMPRRRGMLCRPASLLPSSAVQLHSPLMRIFHQDSDTEFQVPARHIPVEPCLCRPGVPTPSSSSASRRPPAPSTPLSRLSAGFPGRSPAGLQVPRLPASCHDCPVTLRLATARASDECPLCFLRPSRVFLARFPQWLVFFSLGFKSQCAAP